MGRSGKGDEKFSLEISVPPKALADALDHLGESFGDWRPAWRTMLYPVFVRGIEKNLGTQGASLGEKWPRLEKSYAKRKSRLGMRLMLKRTGALRGSMQMLRMVKKSMAYGTALPYARAVQYGKGRIGKRRFVAWSPEMKEKALEIMSAYTSELIKKVMDRQQVTA